MTNTKARITKLEDDLGEIPDSVIEELTDRFIEDVRVMLADGLSRDEIAIRLGDAEFADLACALLEERAARCSGGNTWQ